MKLSLTMSTKVGEFKRTFYDSFGARLRVYVGRSQVDENLPLAGAGLTRSGDFECDSTLTVGDFVQRMADEYGLKVKVYTCDEWVAVLDGLTLEQAGKVKKGAVKADMEKILASQQSDSTINSSDIKESASIGAYLINIDNNGSVFVFRKQVKFENSKAGLREISYNIGFPIDENWTTRQLGSKLVAAIKTGNYKISPVTFFIDGIIYNRHKENELTVSGGTNDSPVDVVVPSCIEYEGRSYLVTRIGMDDYETEEEMENAEGYSYLSEEEQDDLERYNVLDCGYSWDDGSWADDERHNQGFIGNRSMRSISLPTSITEYLINAFDQVNSLREIVIGSGNKVIQSYSITDCENLEKVVIGPGVTTIESCAIDGCENLKEIVIEESPENVKIDSDAFSDCSPNLKVTFKQAQDTDIIATKKSSGDTSLLNVLIEDIEDFCEHWNTLFANERDIQVGLSVWLSQKNHYDLIDTEYSIPMPELAARGIIQGDIDFPWMNRNNVAIDIVVEKDGLYAAVELKYSTQPVDGQFQIFGEEYKSTESTFLKNQAAGNLLLYNYWKDVHRIEVMKRIFPKLVGGVSLLITNCTFWTPPTRDDCTYHEFSAHEGSNVGSADGSKVLQFGEQAAQSILESYPPFHIDGYYTQHWHDMVNIEASKKFRYLMTVIQ